MEPKYLTHVTLLTGDSITHRLDLIPEDLLEPLHRILPHGGPIPHFPAFHCKIEGLTFLISRANEPIVWCVLGDQQYDAWDQVAALQQKLGPLKATKPKGTWLAVVILPGLLQTSRNDISWLADFERCMAYVLLKIHNL
ncbi:MAG: hypothetical protein RIS92_1569 [Verrucomicrobiota bacterium]|jgi:hypothetical protein